MAKKFLYAIILIAVVIWVVWYFLKPPSAPKQEGKAEKETTQKAPEAEETIQNATLNSVTKSGAEWNLVAKEATFKQGGKVIVLKDATITQDRPYRKMVASELTLYLDENKKIIRAVAKGRPTFWF